MRSSCATPWDNFEGVIVLNVLVRFTPDRCMAQHDDRLQLLQFCTDPSGGSQLMFHVKGTIMLLLLLLLLLLLPLLLLLYLLVLP